MQEHISWFIGLNKLFFSNLTVLICYAHDPMDDNLVKGNILHCTLFMKGLIDHRFNYYYLGTNDVLSNDVLLNCSFLTTQEEKKKDKSR